ncbi:FadR/GntR family transcriptional regulator [Arenibacter algicola]|uniref:HTH-type transcriptional regulator LutR n=1 Tax=Arenibacter algicola TaxID=616991 RepID=A0A221UTI8_9FLAO|nr:FadR/GntR family transcriptional regulator [Arenibacter algicola]ASO04637.1 HTH-type transcriptional regulator LutR [Arenibacter algicola]
MDLLDKENFKSVTRAKNLSSQIEEQLIIAINKGLYSSGELLPSENELTEIFDVSRGVVREALLMLSAKGIVEIKKGKGALVLSPSVKSLFEPLTALINYKCGNRGFDCTQQVRKSIEPFIAGLAAENKNSKDLKNMQKCIENMELNSTDKEKLTYYDVEFHKAISQASGNPMFLIIMEPIYNFLRTYHNSELEGRSTYSVTREFHNTIYKAIENGDRDEAYNAMLNHLKVGENKS